MATYIKLAMLGCLLICPCGVVGSQEPKDQPKVEQSDCICQGRQIIGQTAVIEEKSSGAKFLARVDTGAESCSLHAKKVVVEGVDPDMRNNIGKTVKFSVVTTDDKELWIESKIHSTVIVKTSEEQERRYKVWLTFDYKGIQKRVLVTLNDRSEMDYRFLVGRNFLNGTFLVDVSLESDN